MCRQLRKLFKTTPFGPGRIELSRWRATASRWPGTWRRLHLRNGQDIFEIIERRIPNVRNVGHDDGVIRGGVAALSRCFESVSWRRSALLVACKIGCDFCKRGSDAPPPRLCLYVIRNWRASALMVRGEKIDQIDATTGFRDERGPGQGAAGHELPQPYD